jgi:D-sedoheptulose 7-phosphate isomerase
VEKLVQKAFSETIKAQQGFFTEDNIGVVIQAATLVSDAFKAGNKLMIVGNGGSAADAQHLVAEFVNRFQIERPPLPALALTTDSSVLTSIGNDYDFALIFSKQVKALGKGGDVLLAISTSGNSTNVIEAVVAAQALGIKTVALTGGDGGALAKKADIVLNVSAEVTARVQEVHITIGHIICELVDDILFGDNLAQAEGDVS